MSTPLAEPADGSCTESTERYRTESVERYRTEPTERYRTEPTERYRTEDVPVRGGNLRVGVWDSADVGASKSPERVILAVHGVTASHRAWSLVAERLTAVPGVRVLAPDLRGRGRSADLPGPWGFAQHAVDLAAVLNRFDVGRAVLVGHSMGGFVAVIAAQRHQDRVAALVLVDGGVPLVLPPGMSVEDALRATLGPAAERLSMTFADRASYERFWRQHPAFADAWSPAVASYVNYDLVPTTGGLRSSARYEAVAQDSSELAGDILLDAWQAVNAPTTFLRAPGGMLGAEPGLYPEPAVRNWRKLHPDFSWNDVPGVNHYTITLGASGADAVVREVQRQL